MSVGVSVSQVVFGLTLALFGNGCAGTARPAVPVVPVEPVVSTQTPPEAAAGQPRLRFGAFAKSLANNCATKPEEETTYGMLEAAAHENECLSDAVRDALKDAATRDGAGVRALNASHDDLVADLCWVSEELVWVNFEEGWRDDGSLRNFQWLSCERKQRIEQSYLLRSMDLHDAKGFAAHVMSSQRTGKMEMKALATNRAKAKELLVGGNKNKANLNGFAPLTDDSKKEYVVRMQSVADKTRTLATGTCAMFAGLESELGGAESCRDKVATYYASRSYLGTDGGGIDTDSAP